MIMADDKKGLASIIVGSMKRPSLDSMKDANNEAFEAQATPEEKAEVDPGLLEAAHEILAAVERKDADALAGALQNAFVMCAEMPEEKEEV